MNRTILAAALLAAASPVAARAHVVAGDRVFPVTLTFDDPGVADEASIPSFAYSRTGASDGTASHEADLGLEFDKTITSNTALILNWGWDIQQNDGAKTQTGFENLVVTGKWQAITNAEHEFVASLGLAREWGGTGTTHLNGDRFGATSVTSYFGKGLGDLPAGFLRPFAVSGEFSRSFADKGLKNLQTPLPAGGIASQFNAGSSGAWSGGFALQYSLPYLQSQVRDVGLRGVLGDLIPIVEVTWSSPATSPSAQGTTWVAAPGIVYMAQWGEIGVEALFPLNRASGTNMGVVGLVHVFLDDLLPDSLGKPIFD